tara:strand:+ start:12772 stop:12996 length:225 start_codon:yes stop_codon:yes gene_type:complete
MDNAFEEILDPRNFIKRFTDAEHFKEWARGFIINEPKAHIQTFEHYEMYSVCEDIQDVIDEKVSKMLSGLGFED